MLWPRGLKMQMWKHQGQCHQHEQKWQSGAVTEGKPARTDCTGYRGVWSGLESRAGEVPEQMSRIRATGKQEQSLLSPVCLATAWKSLTVSRGPVHIVTTLPFILIMHEHVRRQTHWYHIDFYSFSCKICLTDIRELVANSRLHYTRERHMAHTRSAVRTFWKPGSTGIDGIIILGRFGALEANLTPHAY